MAYRKGIVFTFQLGLLPVTLIGNLDNAIVDSDSGLKQVCTGTPDAEHAPTQISLKRTCATCGEIPYGQIKKAQVLGDGFKVVTDEEVAQVKNETLGATKKMVTLTAHPTEGVAGKILTGGSIYTVSPSDPAQMQAYAILHDVVTRHPDVTLLGLFTPASRTNLYRLGTYGDALVLEQQHRTNEINIVEPMTPPIGAAAEAQIDTFLAGSLQVFDPANYVDAYAERLAEVLAAKDAVEGVATEKTKSAPKTPTTVGGVDLMAQLMSMSAPAPTAKPTRKKATA